MTEVAPLASGGRAWRPALGSRLAVNFSAACTLSEHSFTPSVKRGSVKQPSSYSFGSPHSFFTLRPSPPPSQNLSGPRRPDSAVLDRLGCQHGLEEPVGLPVKAAQAALLAAAPPPPPEASAAAWRPKPFPVQGRAPGERSASEGTQSCS